MQKLHYKNGIYVTGNISGQVFPFLFEKVIEKNGKNIGEFTENITQKVNIKKVMPRNIKIQSFLNKTEKFVEFSGAEISIPTLAIIKVKGHSMAFLVIISDIICKNNILYYDINEIGDENELISSEVYEIYIPEYKK